MPPFRFHIPFFSNKSPSRLSSWTSSPSPSPPPTPPPPPPSRPPFRPAGIAQPSKPDTKSKVSPSLSRVRSNVAAIAASLSESSSGASTPTRLAKQTNKLTGSPSKKLESLRTEEQKLTMKEKPSGETEKVAGENINPVIEKPPIARPEEQRKKTDGEKLTVQERKKVLPEGSGEKLEADKGQQKRKEKEKLAVQENKRVFPEGSGVKSEADQGQQKIKEKDKLAAQESKTVLHKAGQEKSEVNRLRENREAADHGQQKRKEYEKFGLQKLNSAHQTVGRENATRSKTTRHIAAASEATRGPKDLQETKTKTQNRAEIHTDDTHQKTKGASTSNLGNPRVTNEEGSSSMSKRIKEDVRDGISKLTWGKSNGDEKSVSVFTLTGENRGATMGIGSEKDKKDGEVHIHRGYRSNPDESPNTTTTETEGGRRPFKGQNLEDEDEEDRVRAYVNGNTQGINNSIVVESSVSENDPGVHMSLIFEKSMKQIINQPENVAEKKPETVIATEKLRSEPRVRRRCLRGLLAESSESEPENSLKPRRHGCRFTCKDKI